MEFQSWKNGIEAILTTPMSIGRAWWYITYFLESGDKVYARADGTTQTQRSFNESSTSKFFGIITITGGTGEFKNIRGILRSKIRFNRKRVTT